MDNLTKTLLTGGAMSALAAAPAAAAGAPNFHLAVSNGDHALVLKNGSVHNKTGIHNPKAITKTQRATFTYTGKESTMYRKKVFLGHGTTWYTTTTKAPNVCKTIPGQRGRVLVQPQGMKVHDHPYTQHVSITVTGFHCTGTITFYGPDAYITTKHVNTRTVRFTFTDFIRRYQPQNSKFFYNLYAYQDWTVNIE